MCVPLSISEYKLCPLYVTVFWFFFEKKFLKLKMILYGGHHVNVYDIGDLFNLFLHFLNCIVLALFLELDFFRYRFYTSVL